MLISSILGTVLAFAPAASSSAKSAPRKPPREIKMPALEGKVVPQAIKLPLAKAETPNMKDGTDYYVAQSDNFFVGNAFPTCGINFTAQEIMGQTQENQ